MRRAAALAVPSTSMLLLKPRWIAGHLLAFVLTSAFIAAGVWQIQRQHFSQHQLHEEVAAFGAPAPDLATVDATASAASGTRVSVTGTYDPQHEYLLRNISRRGRVGFDVLTPLRYAGGAVLVDRGFVTLEAVDAGLHDAAPPWGQVTVRGVLQPTSPLQPGEQVTPQDGIPSYPRVDTAHIASSAGAPLTPAYVQATYQSPAPGSGAPAFPPPKPTTQVNHVSYAIQWFAFASIAIIGWPIVLRRALRKQPRAPDPSPPEPTDANMRQYTPI
jgi:cytochrome oxidase assembly protein ShyY1